MKGRRSFLALIAVCERHPVLLAAWEAELCAADDNDRATWNGKELAGNAYDANRAVIAAVQPQTLAGVLAKARAALAEVDPSVAFASDADRWARDVLHDLIRLAGAGA